MNKATTPPWYDESKLRKAYYAQGYSGWVIDLGDGTGRYANNPLLGADPGIQEDGSYLSQEEADVINAAAPRWGDRVKLERRNGALWADSSTILERWEPELFNPKNGERLPS